MSGAAAPCLYWEGTREENKDYFSQYTWGEVYVQANFEEKKNQKKGAIQKKKKLR